PSPRQADPTVSAASALDRPTLKHAGLMVARLRSATALCNQRIDGPGVISAGVGERMIAATQR
ncbi:MAG: hypothetical protein ACRDU4_17450, partial [Mycobacterium sp.]